MRSYKTLALLRSSGTFAAIFIIIGGILFTSQAYSLQASKSDIQAEVTLRLINQVSWQNERSTDTFRIAFLGDDPDYYHALKKAIVNRRIRGKSLKLVTISSSHELQNFHILIVGKNTKLPFSELAIKARRNHTLIISEEEDDRIHIMINFLFSGDDSLSFEFNRPNILLAKLTIKNDILLVGGTELDVAELYREMEEDLSKLQQTLKSTKEKSSLASIQFEKSTTQFNDTQMELLDIQSNLKVVIANQEKNIASRQEKFDLKSAAADKELERVTKQTEELMATVKSEVHKQQQLVNEKKIQLQGLEDEITNLSSNLNKKSEMIRDREQLLYIASIALLAFLSLVFLLYRLGADRKRFSLELKKRSDSLEEEVKMRTSQYRALSESSPVGVIQTNVYGDCEYVNERWCEYSGLTREQAMGKGWIKAVHPEDRSQLSEQWDDHILTQKMFYSEYRFLTPDGEVRWLLGQCNAEYNDIGELQGYICTVTDITHQKDLQEQVRRSQKMDALGKLTGGVAHDFNNMLSITKGYAELLKIKLPEESALHPNVDKIIHASQRGAALTKKLLAFSKGGPTNATVANINALLEYQQQILEKTLTPGSIFTLDLEEELWNVWMDVGDFEDALINMSINAGHAMENGGTLTISTTNHTVTKADLHPQLKAGDYALLTISDSGTGMDEETQEKLFDPFFSTKGANGTGLGLSQVYSFVNRSDGYIDIESTPDIGTTFSLYFPRHKATTQIPLPIDKNVVVNVRGSEAILIVDDEPSLLSLVSEVLEKQGYRTYSAIGGEEALEILLNNNIDLLLSDVIMPEMDGYQLAAEVQRLYPSVLIQLVSGYASEEMKRDKGKNLINKILLPKPYQPKVLLQQLRVLFDERKDALKASQPSYIAN